MMPTFKRLAIVTLMLSLAACQRDTHDEERKANTETTTQKALPKPGEESPPEQPAALVDLNDPDACAGCHGAIADEWKESMHSMAHHEKDAIYGAMRALRMKKQGAHIAKKCAKCHNPRSPTDTTTKAALAGVSCATCHNAAKVHVEPGKAGDDAIEWHPNGMLTSARDIKAGASPVHPTGPSSPVLADGKTMCLACHSNTKTPSGEAACTTGSEFAASKSGETCVSCHMPEVEGPAGAVGRQDKHRSHRFLGPHRAWYQSDTAILAEALETKFELQGKEATLTLSNKSAHAFPSGFPGRMVVVKVLGKNKEGKVVWQNFKENAMAEHPDSVLNQVYHDKEGNPVPAPFSEKLVRDTRLKADEVRELAYTVPAEVVELEAKILYFLVPPPLANKLGLSNKPEGSPKVIATVTSH